MSFGEKQLEAAREAWGAGLIDIAKVYEAGGIAEARRVASALLDRLYGFEYGPVLFKPTLSGGAQTFRPTKQGALSYFIGHDDGYPQDGGFGLRAWRQFEATTSSVFIDGNVGLWMGWVTLTDKDGASVTVDKSFGYKLAEDGALKIVLHHSSLPYQP